MGDSQEAAGLGGLFARREFRDELLSALPISDRAAALLMALDRLVDRWGIVDDVGNSILDPPTSAIGAAMENASQDTVGRAIRDVESTPYLAVDRSKGRASVYTLRWPEIFEHWNHRKDIGSAGGSAGTSARRTTRRTTRKTASAGTAAGGTGYPQHPSHGALGSMNESPCANGDLENGSRRGKPRLRLGRDIKTDELRRPEICEFLWHEMVKQGVFLNTEFWRQVMYGLCLSIYRKRSEFRNPVGMLLTILRRGAQQVLKEVTNENMDDAKRLLVIVDGRPQERTSNLGEKPADKSQWTEDNKAKLAQELASGRLNNS